MKNNKKWLFPVLGLILMINLLYNPISIYSGKGVINELGWQSWIAGSIIKARKDGVFSTGTFTNIWIPKKMKAPKARAFNANKYKRGLKRIRTKKGTGSWSTYKSAIRWPNTIYEIIDIGIYKITGTPRNLFWLHRTIAGLFLTFTMLLFFKWSHREFGLFSLIASFIILLSCHWLMILGTYAGFGIWLNILPAAVGLILFEKKRKYFNPDNYLHILLYGMVCIFLNASRHYAHVPVVSFSLFIPVLFYSTYTLKDYKKIILKLFFVGIGCILGFILCFGIHFLMIYSIRGTWEKTVAFFEFKFLHRTSGNLESDAHNFSRLVDKAHAAGFMDVMKRYWNEKPLLSFLNLKHIVWMFIISIPSLFIPSLFTKQSISLLKYRKLFLATLVSFIGAISFFYIFKSHAYLHVHLDYIVLCTPFILFFVLYYVEFIKVLVEKLKATLNKQTIEA